MMNEIIVIVFECNQIKDHDIFQNIICKSEHVYMSCKKKKKNANTQIHKILITDDYKF